MSIVLAILRVPSAIAAAPCSNYLWLASTLDVRTNSKASFVTRHSSFIHFSHFFHSFDFERTGFDVRSALALFEMPSGVFRRDHMMVACAGMLNRRGN